jgi:hypothetical protein
VIRLLLVLACTLALGGCSIIRAQTPTQLPSGTVSGVVTGPSAPIGGAAITITPSDNSYHAATSDAQGYYSLGGLLTGPAALEIAAAGYQTYTTSITVPPNDTITINVSLTPR